MQNKYYCTICGLESQKWMGKCKNCESWNSIIEKNDNITHYEKDINLININEVKDIKESRIDIYNNELKNVLGGGLVKGSSILIAGEPGIGKSTLILQIVLKIIKTTIYVSGEESANQIKLRSKRLNISSNNCFLLISPNINKIINICIELKPEIVVIDSIQTIYDNNLKSSQGSIQQIKDSCLKLIEYGKKNNICFIFIGHITKEGYIAGPKILEHMVDVVLHFESKYKSSYRIIRCKKNRYGPTSEIGIFEMNKNGLKEVTSPSYFTSGYDNKDLLSGNCISIIVEGLRPLIIQTQALVSSAVYGTPQRTSTGFDSKRLNMVLAVLEKRCGFKLNSKDVFMNIIGGMKINDTAIDLAVIVSILSSNYDIPIDTKYCFCGELGLSGEIITVEKINERIKEAEKNGFTKIFVPLYSNIISTCNIEIVKISKISEINKYLFI